MLLQRPIYASPASTIATTRPATRHTAVDAPARVDLEPHQDAAQATLEVDTAELELAEVPGGGGREGREHALDIGTSLYQVAPVSA